jgi:hypothetical protein
MGNKPSQNEHEKITNPFVELDNKKIIEKKLTHLNFYEKFEAEFPFLRHFLLSDYMNLLNSFTIKTEKENNPEKGKNNVDQIEEEENFSKDNWMRFFDLKILHNPIIERINPTPLEIKQQQQLWDDIFDDVKQCYNLANQTDCDTIPKSIFFAVGFIYCMNKKSQKIIILANLFTGKDNKITIDNNLYTFFFLIYYLVLFTPIRLFEKEIDPDLPDNNYIKKIKARNVQSMKNNFLTLKNCVNYLVNELIDNLFYEGSEIYNREDFITKILEEKNNFIFSNLALKGKIEDKMNEKEITSL